MQSTAKFYFKAMKILDMIIGIIYCITIVGMIFGIPLIIASKRFGKASQLESDYLVEHRGGLLGWGIFSAIAFAPSVIGFIVIIVLAISANNYIKNLESGDIEKANRTFGEAVKEGTSKAWNGTKEAFGVKSELDAQCEQLTKLKQMYENGILTEEEYNLKRKSILGI